MHCTYFLTFVRARFKRRQRVGKYCYIQSIRALYHSISQRNAWAIVIKIACLSQSKFIRKYLFFASMKLMLVHFTPMGNIYFSFCQTPQLCWLDLPIQTFHWKARRLAPHSSSGHSYSRSLDYKFGSSIT